MVQVGSPFGYDNGVEHREEQPGQPWTNLVSDAVRDFVANISESSRQLSASAERFAAEPRRMPEDATNPVQQWAASSNEMAGAARRAAEEARLAATAIREAISEAGQHVRD